MRYGEDKIRLIRRNINTNARRADKEWAKDHKVTEAPEYIKKYHRESFENAQYETERQKNIKRGVR